MLLGIAKENHQFQECALGLVIIDSLEAANQIGVLAILNEGHQNSGTPELLKLGHECLRFLYRYIALRWPVHAEQVRHVGAGSARLGQAWPDHEFELEDDEAHVELEIDEIVVPHLDPRLFLQLALLLFGVASLQRDRLPLFPP